MRKLLTAFVLAGLFCAGHIATIYAKGISAEEFEASLKYQHGKINLPSAHATLNVPDGFRYLDPVETNKVLETAWGNPPGSKTLGMLLPSDVSPLDRDSWGVVIFYENDGHVSDDDAQEIDYTDLLKKMQDESREASKERVKQGYSSLELVGWAEQPSYNASTHKMYWAKELKASDSQEDTLNYNIRVLGREGVLILNAVAGMHQLDQMKHEMQTVLAFSNFNKGERYEDFNPSSDKVAEYGLAALVGGAVAAKTGLFAKLIAMLIAAKKFIIIGLVAIAGFFKKFFRRKSE